MWWSRRRDEVIKVMKRSQNPFFSQFETEKPIDKKYIYFRCCLFGIVLRRKILRVKALWQTNLFKNQNFFLAFVYALANCFMATLLALNEKYIFFLPHAQICEYEFGTFRETKKIICLYMKRIDTYGTDWLTYLHSLPIQKKLFYLFAEFIYAFFFLFWMYLSHSPSSASYSLLLNAHMWPFCNLDDGKYIYSHTQICL